MSSGLEARNRKPSHIGLRQQVLLAALDCSHGDLNRTFTAEDLLLAAWKRDPLTWGLLGHQREHPDSEKMYKELDPRGSKSPGVVGLGLFEKLRQRIYRLTPAGLIAASEVAGAEPSMRLRAERGLADALGSILSHPVLRAWIKDSATPKYFRDAGHFWGIAPGTPASVIRARISDIDNTLERARTLLERRNVGEVAVSHGRVLFDRTDVERAAEFQAMLKRRFEKELSTLQVRIRG